MNNALKELYKRKKVLFFDIETSPNVGLFFKSGYDLNIDTDAILKERQIICISWEWGHSSEKFSLNWGLKKQNDKQLCKKFSKILSSADIVIGHNSDNFDIKWLRGRLAFHGLPNINVNQTYDTLKLARRAFNLNSFKLKYLLKYFNEGAKDPMEFGDWKGVLLGDKDSLVKMIKYCGKDVSGDKRLFGRIFPYITLSGMHFGALINADKTACRQCGVKDWMKNGTRITNTGIRYRRIQCKSCGFNDKGEKL